MTRRFGTANEAFNQIVDFLEHFTDLDDPRQRATVLYPLDEVLLLCLLGVPAGCESWVEIAKYGERKLTFLRRFRPFTDGTPSHDQLGDIFAGEDLVVAIQPGFHRRRRIGHDEACSAVGKGHDKEMGSQLDASDDRIRLAEIRLHMPRRMPRRMYQRHEHLPQTTAPFADVILDDGLAAGEAMLIAKALEYPLCRVALLTVNRAVRFQNAVNDIRERVQLRPLRRLAAPVSRRHRVPQHLLHCIAR